MKGCGVLLSSAILSGSTAYSFILQQGDHHILSSFSIFSLLIGYREHRNLNATILSIMKGTTMSYPGDSTVNPIFVTGSGLGYVDILVGDGDLPGAGDIVSVHYTGYLVNGKQFDSSRERGSPFSFTLGKGEVIRGWDEGVASMRVGGKRKLIIPPKLGYGSRGAGDVIPPDAELIFDVELLEVSSSR